MNKISSLSDVSRTNQLRINEPPEVVANKLFQYLFKSGKGIESFIANDLDLSSFDPSLKFYQKQHKAIKHEIQKRLAKDGESLKESDIQYSLSYVDGKNFVFFLSPNKSHSGWTEFFQKNSYCRQKILNLIFKVFLLSKELPSETLTGFEELLLVHSKSVKPEKALFVWGQNLSINYNQHNVLTLCLSRKYRLFLPKDKYKTLDAESIGEILVHNNKSYYFQRDLDARSKNHIYFMSIEKDNEDNLKYTKFKKTQIYHYQSLMNQLEVLLKESGISYELLNFQSDYYLENPFISSIESVDAVEIINNSGTDLSTSNKDVLENILKHQGVTTISFFNSGNTITTYEPIESTDEEKTYWKITEVFPWAGVKLDTNRNYLVFNKLLDEESGSMAYCQDDGLWNPSEKSGNKSKIDFYSRLKQDLNYLQTKNFISVQGINVEEFKAIGDIDSTWSILNYDSDKIDEDSLRQDTQSFTGGKYLSAEDEIYLFLASKQSSEKIEEFYQKHKISISPEFQKVIIELGIKNWIRSSLIKSDTPLLISSKDTFPEKSFFAIYVRNPHYQDAKAIAVEFAHKSGYVYIMGIMRDLSEIKKRFPFLRTRKNNTDQLIEQQLLVDETDKIWISCYTNDYFTPTLIGRNEIIDELEKGELEINRKRANNILPLVMSYNKEVKQVKNLICLDLRNKTFIQYFVPPAQSLREKIKKGFRIYHMIGYTYSGEQVPTEKLIDHPMAGLHFNTLTQNILKISENSQSSLLQKVAKVFIEN